MVASLDDAIARLKEVIRPRKVFLFGSRARGDAAPDSDMDLLVVADLPGNRAERTAAVNLALFPRLVPMDLLVYTSEEFHRLLGEPDSFVHHIVTTGRLAYDAEDPGMARQGAAGPEGREDPGRDGRR